MSTLAVEVERLGLPAVVVTALPSIARLAGANRILRGRAVTHPLGDPSLARGDEIELRRRMVERALSMLGQSVSTGTIWDLEP